MCPALPTPPLPPRQDENADSSRSTALLQERLRGLQSVCLQLDQQQQLAAHGGGGSSSSPAASVQQAALLEQLTSTLRALGPASGLTPTAAGPSRLPPAVAGARVEAAAKGLPTDLRLALRQLEALRRERDGLAARLKATDAQVGWAVTRGNLVTIL